MGKTQLYSQGGTLPIPCQGEGVMVTGEGELYQGNYRQKRKIMESSIEITGKLEIKLEKKRWIRVFHRLEDARRLFLFCFQDC